jgi:glutaredoxin
MFLIYGNANCKYCSMAKELLNLHKIPYIYVNLNDIYGDLNWKQAFADIKPILKAQNTIPFIFKTKLKESFESSKILEFTVDGLKDYTFIGTYFDLVDLIEDESAQSDVIKSIDNDY